MSIEFGQLIKRLCKERGFTVKQLEPRVKISSESLNKIIQGRWSKTQLSRSRATLLRNELCKTSDEGTEFDATLLRAWKEVPSPLKLALDSPEAVLRIVPVPYPPFSGKDCRFLDQFLKTMLELAAIRYEVPEMIQAQAAAEQFDVGQRIDWLSRREADVLLNLASLQRLKKIRFLLTPIRVSLNGVLVRPHPHLERSETLLSEARLLLAGDGLVHLKKFRLFAIRNEVGWVHLVQKLRVPITELTEFTTLGAEQLSDSLRKWNGGAHPLLVCDEITAMSVLQALAGEGMLVFQPSSDESVMSSGKRRQLPAHPLGIGFRREDQELYGYMSEALRTFLTYETETIAALYEKLYGELVHHVQECLKNDSALYLGGARRVSMDKLDQTQVEALSHQNARAYARRCLQLNRKTIPENVDSFGWVRVLRRARERVQGAEANDRKTIKSIVVSAFKTVIGLDPMKSGLQFSYSSFHYAISTQWPKLRYLLERELNTDLSLLDARFRDVLASGDLEGFVSQMQTLMEASAHTANVTVVNEASLHDETYLDLRHQYEGGKPTKSLTGATVLIARNLGEAVGFITVRSGNPRVSTFPSSGHKRIELLEIYVVKYMRREGIRNRLIREAVDYADQKDAHSVWFDRQSREKRIIDLFLKSGFVEEDNHIVSYTLDRLKPTSHYGSSSKVRKIAAKR
jgi:ribosomal protein S18 acetylase RimI-like enzyme